MADQRIFTGISRAQIDAIRVGLKKNGIQMPKGDDVEVSGPFGVKMKVSYDEPKKTLRLAITDKPVFISENQIWKVVESGAKLNLP